MTASVCAVFSPLWHCLLQWLTVDGEDQLKVCPGFLLESSSLWSSPEEEAVLLDMRGVVFRRGKFHIQTLPHLNYSVSIEVSKVVIFIYYYCTM